MKTLIIACHLVMFCLLVAPANAATGGNAEWAKRCQTEYTALGYRNAGQCVSHYARGGGEVVTGPATLSLTFDTALCSDGSGQQCVWSVQGSGLDPGSQVTVGESAVMYGATVTVDSAGAVAVRGIFHFGSCVVSGFQNQSFVARGVAADGTPVSSAVVLGDLSQLIPICP